MNRILVTYLVITCSLMAADTADSPTKLIADFADPAKAAERWKTINDNVMGGRSTGGPTFKDGLLRFRGSTNTDGGGFSSIRRDLDGKVLAGATGIRLRVRGDGRTYKLDMHTDKKGWSWAGRMPIAYRADFTTKDGEWVIINIPFAKLVPTLLGRERDRPAFEQLKVSTIGFMIYDKQDGPFQLEVDWIGVY